MIDTYLSQRSNILKVILLIDSRRGITQDDKEMITYFDHSNIPFVVIGTKLDKVNQSDKTKFLRNIKEELDTTPIMYSALTKKGVDNILSVFADHVE